MRTLSSSLLAAQQSDSRVPYFKVVASNRAAGVVRLRWQRLYQGVEPDGGHGVCLPGDGSLVRVRVGPAGEGSRLHRQRVVDPGPLSDFSAWTFTGESDCQTMAVASCGAEVNIFWATYDADIMQMQSADYGVTWGSPAVIDLAPDLTVSGMSAAYKPNGDIALFYASGDMVCVKRRVSGTWQGRVVWDKTTGELGSVAAVYESDWRLIVTGRDASGNYKVWSLLFGDGSELPEGEWSGLNELASAPAGGDYEYAAAFMDCPDVSRLFYLEKCNGVESYARPCWTHAMPGGAFSDGVWREPVPFDVTCGFGLAIAHHGTYCWLSMPSGVWRASLSPDEVELTEDVDGARVRSAPSSGGAVIELRNDGGKYNSPGSGVLGVLDFGCQIDIGPGYVTSAGRESSGGQSFWIESREHLSGGGKASLVLHCIDGWKLLEGWRARHQFRWNQGTEERSVRQIIEFVLARVGIGLTVSSQSSDITGSYPDFTIQPGESGLTVLEKLLSFVPDVLSVEGLSAYLIYPEPSDQSVYSYGTAHAILNGGYMAGTVRAGHLRVEGRDPETGGPLSVDSFNWDGVGSFPERFDHVSDLNVATVAQAQSRGAAILRKAEMAAVGGALRVPVNCGQQTYDVIDITDAGAGLAAAKRRVVGFETVYRPSRGGYEQILYLGGV